MDLIDGDELVEKLKDLRLGISVSEKIVEEVHVDKAWFSALWSQNAAACRRNRVVFTIRHFS